MKNTRHSERVKLNYFHYSTNQILGSWQDKISCLKCEAIQLDFICYKYVICHIIFTTQLGLFFQSNRLTKLLYLFYLFQSLLTVLRESHRTRTVFRKVGGFVYVMSVLVSMEGCFASPPKAPWDTGRSSSVLNF